MPDGFIRKAVSILISLAFLANSLLPALVSAQGIDRLPAPGGMIEPSGDFTPVMMKGLQLHPDNPLLFDLLIDSGDTDFSLQGQDFRNESQKLIKYFLAALTLKEDELWVNLSPYEKERMVPEELGKTDLGRDMLAQDYVLKQLTSSLMYPEKDLGKAFWKKVYARAQEQFGTSDIPVDTFNKVWIVADKARVVEKNNTAFITAAHLKVMLDRDFLAAQNAMPTRGANPTPSSQDSLQKEILQEIILPAIEKEVNEGKNFAPLRQMFYSMILATWYKDAVKNALLNQVYSNQSRTGGVLSDDPQVKEKIYERYMSAFKSGAFNYIKEETDPSAEQVVSRRYFAGGIASNFLIRPVLDLTRTAAASDMAQLQAKGHMARVVMNVVMLSSPALSSGASDAAQNNDIPKTLSPQYERAVIDPIAALLLRKNAYGRQSAFVMTIEGLAGSGKTTLGRILAAKGVGSFRSEEIALVDMDRVLNESLNIDPVESKLKLDAEMEEYRKTKKLILVVGPWSRRVVKGQASVFLDGNPVFSRVHTAARDGLVDAYLLSKTKFVDKKAKYDLVIRDIPTVVPHLESLNEEPVSLSFPGQEEYGKQTTGHSFVVTYENWKGVIDTLFYMLFDQKKIKGYPAMSRETSELEDALHCVSVSLRYLFSQENDTVKLTVRRFEHGFQFIFSVNKMDLRNSWEKKDVTTQLLGNLSVKATEVIISDQKDWYSMTYAAPWSLSGKAGLPNGTIAVGFLSKKIDPLMIYERSSNRSLVRVSGSQLDFAQKLSPEFTTEVIRPIEAALHKKGVLGRNNIFIMLEGISGSGKSTLGHYLSRQKMAGINLGEIGVLFTDRFIDEKSKVFQYEECWEDFRQLVQDNRMVIVEGLYAEAFFNYLNIDPHLKVLLDVPDMEARYKAIWRDSGLGRYFVGRDLAERLLIKPNYFTSLLEKFGVVSSKYDLVLKNVPSILSGLQRAPETSKVAFPSVELYGQVMDEKGYEVTFANHPAVINVLQEAVKGTGLEQESRRSRDPVYSDFEILLVAVGDALKRLFKERNEQVRLTVRRYRQGVQVILDADSGAKIRLHELVLNSLESPLLVNARQPESLVWTSSGWEARTLRREWSSPEKANNEGVTVAFGLPGGIIDPSWWKTSAKRSESESVSAAGNVKGEDSAQGTLSEQDFLHAFRELMASGKDGTFNPARDEALARMLQRLSRQDVKSSPLTREFFIKMEDQFWQGRLDRVEEWVWEGYYNEAGLLLDFVGKNQARLSSRLQKRMQDVRDYFWNRRLDEAEDLITVRDLNKAQDALHLLLAEMNVEYRVTSRRSPAMDRAVRAQKAYWRVFYGRWLMQVVNVYRSGGRVSSEVLNLIRKNIDYLTAEQRRMFQQLDQLVMFGDGSELKSRPGLESSRSSVAAAEVMLRAGNTDMARKMLERVAQGSLLARDEKIDKKIAVMRYEVSVREINAIDAFIRSVTRFPNLTDAEIERLRKKVQAVEAWPLEERPSGALAWARAWENVFEENQIKWAIGSSIETLDLTGLLNSLRRNGKASAYGLDYQQRILEKLTAEISRQIAQQAGQKDVAGLQGSLRRMLDLPLSRIHSRDAFVLEKVLNSLLSANVPIGLDEASSSDKAQQAPGGIDLDPRRMEWDAAQAGSLHQMGIDPKVISQIQQSGLTGVKGSIIKIMPETNLPAVFAFEGASSP